MIAWELLPNKDRSRWTQYDNCRGLNYTGNETGCKCPTLAVVAHGSANVFAQIGWRGVAQTYGSQCPNDVCLESSPCKKTADDGPTNGLHNYAHKHKSKLCDYESCLIANGVKWANDIDIAVCQLPNKVGQTNNRKNEGCYAPNAMPCFAADYHDV